MSILFFFYILLSTLPAPAESPAVCSSTEYLLHYDQLRQCDKGGSPYSCQTLPQGLLDVGLIVSGYIGGQKWGEKIAQSSSNAVNGILESISERRAFQERAKWIDFENRLQNLAQKQPHSAGVIKELRSLDAEIQTELKSGAQAVPINPQITENLNSIMEKLRNHQTGKVILSPSEIRQTLSVAKKAIDDLWVHKYNNLLKSVYAKSDAIKLRAGNWGRTMGPGLGAAMMALADASASLLSKELLYQKCVGKQYPELSQEQVGIIMNFTDFDHSCSMEIKSEKFQELMKQTVSERTAFFEKCPICCAKMDLDRVYRIQKVKARTPIIRSRSCTSDSIHSVVEINGRTYIHNYKRNGSHYTLKSSLTPNNEDLTSQNYFEIGIAKDGHITNPNIHNYNGHIISMNLSKESMPEKLKSWYDNLTEKITPPENATELRDIRKVQYSVAEQLQAVNQAFKSLKAYCDSISQPLPDPEKKAIVEGNTR